METLERHRARIDVTDREIVRLLNHRLRLASELGELKQQIGMPVVDDDRERTVLERVTQFNEGPLDPASLTSIFRNIIHASRQIQLRKRSNQGESR
jgi:chorismate mutase